jgi:hypothetical protein
MKSKSNYFKKTIGGAILGISLVSGIGMLSSTTAQAQYPGYPNQDQYRRERQRQAQLERERQAQIERDRLDQLNRNQGNGRWDNRGDNNGRWNNGNRPGRRGRGDGYGNQGGSYQLRQTALNAGYNEGAKAGRSDRRSGRYDFSRASAYQRANKDYNSRLGDRNMYAQYFRQAFENGYSDGYYGY